MYRLVSRRAVAQASQVFSKRTYRTHHHGGLRATKKLFFGAGITLVPGIMAFNYLNTNHIDNEVDEKKIEESQKKAESSAKKESGDKEKKEAIGKAEVTTKVPAEEATPETKSEVKDGETSEETKEGGDNYEGAAYNPETGEINWDCPCLGGMAHGPCGEEFKEAFSCFIYSESEPKGIDCIQKFEVMRNCFREHPEHYKEELYDDEEQEPLVDVNAKEDKVPEQDSKPATEKAAEPTKENASTEVKDSKSE